MVMTPLRLASLDCDIPVPNVYAERGTYSDIFEALFRKSAKTGLGDVGRTLELKITRFDAVRGELPTNEQLNNIDGIILTGSASSAYDEVPWIQALISFCQKVYQLYPRIKLYGSCFGHQVLSHAIFTPLTEHAQPVVSKDPAGWEIGIHPITLKSSFISTFGPVTSNPSAPSQVRLQFIHADHVVLSPALLEQEGFESVGRSEHCALQGVWKRGRVLTYQGHAEFDPFINGELAKVFGKGIWSDEFLEEVLGYITRGEDDAIWAAGVTLKFFLGQDKGQIENFEGEGSGNSSAQEF